MANLSPLPIPFDAGDGLPPAQLRIRMPTAPELAPFVAASAAPPSDTAADVAAAALELTVAIVHRWAHVTDEGEPVPCDDEHKRAFFGPSGYPEAVALVVRHITQRLGARTQEKKASPPGFASGSATPTGGSTVVAPPTSTATSTAAPC